MKAKISLCCGPYGRARGEALFPLPSRRRIYTVLFLQWSAFHPFRFLRNVDGALRLEREACKRDVPKVVETLEVVSGDRVVLGGFGVGWPWGFVERGRLTAVSPETSVLEVRVSRLGLPRAFGRGGAQWGG